MFAYIDHEEKISKIIKIHKRRLSFDNSIDINILVITENGERIYNIKTIILDIIYNKVNILNITKPEIIIMYEMIKKVFEDPYFYHNKDV